jgi:MFS family permease
VAAAARRFAILISVLVTGTAVLATVIGLLFGASISRSVSLGWYIVGSILLILGFFVGNRGPARHKGEGPMTPFSLTRWVRWATPEEQHESLSLSAVFILLGFVIIVLGVLVDSRYPTT